MPCDRNGTQNLRLITYKIMGCESSVWEIHRESHTSDHRCKFANDTDSDNFKYFLFALFQERNVRRQTRTDRMTPQHSHVNIAIMSTRISSHHSEKSLKM